MKRKRIRREIFVLTAEEKKAAACVIGAVVLGLATMQYRATHPRTPRPPTAKEQRVAKIAKRSAASRARAERKVAKQSAPAESPQRDAEEER